MGTLFAGWSARASRGLMHLPGDDSRENGNVPLSHVVHVLFKRGSDPGPFRAIGWDRRGPADPTALAAAQRQGELPVRAAHAAMVRKLPDLHRDPFDRLLIAQALVEPLRLVTSDESLAAYSNLVVLV